MSNDTPIGELVDEMYATRSQISDHNAAIKELEAEKEVLEGRILSLMHVLGTDIARTDIARASATTKSRYNIEDPEVFYEWVCEDPQNRIYLFVKMLSQGAVKELIENEGIEIPGLYKFEREAISLTKR